MTPSRALAIEPDLAEARLAGDWVAARREIRAALAKDPGSLDAWREACEIALASGDAKELERAAKFERFGPGQTSLGVRQNRVYWFKGAIREVRFHDEAVAVEKLQRVN